MYQILSQTSIPGLEQAVNAVLGQGHALVGGPFTSNGSFYQAVNYKEHQSEAISNIGRGMDGQGNGKATASKTQAYDNAKAPNKAPSGPKFRLE
jgi:hypothetical protein